MKNKIKTHKGTAKRFMVTGSGKLRRRHAMRSHNKSKQTTAQSLRRKRDHEVSASNPRIKELIPYK